MQRYAGIELTKTKEGMEIETKQNERFKKQFPKVKEFKTEQEAFDFFFETIKEIEDGMDKFQGEINKTKFFYEGGKIVLFVENEEKIKEKRLRLEDLKLEEAEQWIEKLKELGVSDEEQEVVKENLKKLEKNKKHVYELNSINKVLLVLVDGEELQGLIHEKNHLEIYDVHKELESFEEAMSLMNIENYDKYVMSGWKNSKTFSGLYSKVVNNEEEYYEAIKELTKIKLHKINMGIYGFHTKCSSLMELDEWHELFESELIDYELYDDQYENGEDVKYIQPECFFGDVKLKPMKEEYPCTLVLNTEAERDEPSKFFWVSI